MASEPRLTCVVGQVLSLAELLGRHPNVDGVEVGGEAPLKFIQGSWERRIEIGLWAGAPFGLPELIDNNPLVCADVVGLPDAASTLALIALGPLIRAGVLASAPTMAANTPIDPEAARVALVQAGWAGGLSLCQARPAASGLLLATVEAPLTDADMGDVDELYEEVFGRSFLVRRAGEGTTVWAQPYADYRLSPIGGGLRIRVEAELTGKCGAAQIVHTMNVMAGIEETAGLENYSSIR